jgi:hypothetical protein
MRLIQLFAGRCVFFEENAAPYRGKSAFALLKLDGKRATMKRARMVGLAMGVSAGRDLCIGKSEEPPCLESPDRPRPGQLRGRFWRDSSHAGWGRMSE